MSVGVLLLVFAAAAALVLWHWIAATKQVSEELLEEYQRLLSDARVGEPASDAGESGRGGRNGPAGSGGLGPPS